ncbi:MAG: outer membrane beta-barrel protein [Ferruginibacter sp.]
MKTKLLLAIIFIFSIFSSFAQDKLPKGSLLLGGNIGFSSSKSEIEGQRTDHITSFSISPSAGIAIRDNLFFGLSLGYSHGKERITTNGMVDDSTKFNTYSYGVFLRKYKPLKYNFSIFLQANLAGNNSKYNYSPNSNVFDLSSKGFGAGASLSPGISYAVNSRLQLEAALNNIVSLDYSQVKHTYPGLTGGIDTNKQTNFNVSTSLNNFTSQLSFGFRFLLQKNKTGKS